MIEWLGQFLGLLKLLPLRVWVGLSFMPLGALFLYALIRADLSDRSAFKLIHFVTNDAGRGSYYALGYTSIVVAYVWGLFALIMLDKWSTEYLAVGGGLFIIGALGGTGARLVAKVKGATTEPDAGDNPEASPPVLERETTVRQTERVPANPLVTKRAGKRTR